MIRTLGHTISFGKERELRLVCDRELEEGLDLCEEYIVEGYSRGVHFTFAELLELRAAICEMERMREQHRAALADCDFGFLNRELAASMAEAEGELEPESAAALTVGETDLVSEDDMHLLHQLSMGVTLLMGNVDLDCFRMRGWVHVTPKTESSPTSAREYGITDKGRRALAAQTPEAEPISQAVLVVLRELADGNRLCFDSIRIVWSLEDGREVNLYGASGLKLGGLVEAVTQTADYPPSRTYYDISDEGRRVLAEREG